MFSMAQNLCSIIYIGIDILYTYIQAKIAILIMYAMILCSKQKTFISLSVYQFL
jgi:hypothetical protein